MKPEQFGDDVDRTIEYLDSLTADEWLAAAAAYVESPMLTDSPVQIANALYAIQDSGYNDIKGRIEPYSAVVRSQPAQEAGLLLDAKRFWELVKDRDFVRNEGGGLAGTSITRWQQQKAGHDA